MTRKRIGASIAIVILVFGGLAYHLVFGYVQTIFVSDRITVLTRQSVLAQIGANVVVFEDSVATVVVDTQLGIFASSTRSSVESLTSKPLVAVLITHWHPDHSGGISVFSSDTSVIAHQNVVSRLSSPQEGFGLTKPGSHHQFAARPEGGLPNEAVIDRLDLQTDTSVINIVHYPDAHTDGDLVVLFQDEHIAVIGDLVWPDSFPFVDLHNGGSVAGLENALRLLLADTGPNYRFVPGHGTILTFDDVTVYLDMIVRARQWVEEQLEEGKPPDQIAMGDLPEEWEAWSSTLVPSSVWVQMISDSHRISVVAE